MSGHTSVGKLPVSQVVGCRCTLLAGNYSVSLSESEEQINFSWQSLKMLKMASESFIHALLLFQNFPLGAPLHCPVTSGFAFSPGG